MGVVHLARQPGGERVALKVLRPHIVGDDEARARLAREVNSLRRIRSPRVAEIVDADPWGPVPFVATRYVPGLSLHDHVHEEGPITGPDLVWLARCLADALGAVHACGVLHRDVKPSNVLMEGRSPVLIDFGLARVADDPKLTLTGWLLGTPGYLAPEILHGENATTASDVHSWASTVAFAGTGHPPFGRGPAMAVMDRVRRGEHQLDGLPPRFAALLAAALDPDPRRRPPLAELHAELASPAPAPPVAPRPPPEQDPFTVPLAVAALAGAEESTDPQSVEPAPSEEAGDPTWPPMSAAPAATPWPVRLRRLVMGSTLAAAGGALVAAYPYLATAGLLVGAWLLRSGSLAAGAAGDRRRLRGLKWYDAPQFLLTTPWHLIRSIPGTLLLALWAGGLGLAGLLLGYGAGLPVAETLFLAGLLFASALWFGPGGSRVRGPLQRALRPVTDVAVRWVIGLLVVAATATGAGALATTQGPDWAPADHAPRLP